MDSFSALTLLVGTLKLGLSHWDPYAMHRGGIIVTWWSGAGGIQALSARPTGFLQCFDTVGYVWSYDL